MWALLSCGFLSGPPYVGTIGFIVVPTHPGSRKGREVRVQGRRGKMRGEKNR